MPRYTAKRTDYKPSEMVRCRRCGKLTLKRTATEAYPNVWYGSDCIVKAMASIEQAHQDEVSAQERGDGA